MKPRRLETDFRRAILIAGEEISRPRGDARVGTDHLLAALALGGPADPAIGLLHAVGIDPSSVDAAVRAGWRDAGS